MLIAKDIYKEFKDVQALKGVNLKVNPGFISVLIGPSGSGKTTLLRALALLDIPTKGSITIDDYQYNFPLERGMVISPPWPFLTVVFQQHFLWPHMTLRENMMLPLKERKVKTSSIDELIDTFDMGDFIDRYPNEVSLGQRQRGALARAFALEPRYILLDEITSALDVEQSGTVLRHLMVLRNRGIGILVVTHLLAFARELMSKNEGDRVYFLDDGKILDSGGLDFFRNPDNERIKKFLKSMDIWSEETK